MRTWLITGCSTGLGRALAEAVLSHGDNAVVTARDISRISDLGASRPERVLVRELDVRDRAQVEAVVAAGQARFGAIDVLVNNAGHGYRAAVEEAKMPEVRDLFETNFYGSVAMIQAVLPNMRKRRSGHILNLSSIAGRGAAPGSAYYSATKFAIEGLSDALRKEVAPLGVKVSVIEPGAFRTDFAGRSLQQTQVSIADYASTAGRRRKENDKSHGTQPGDPARAAKALITLVEMASPPFRLALGSDALAFIGAELARQTQELADWADLTRSTDFPA